MNRDKKMQLAPIFSALLGAALISLTPAAGAAETTVTDESFNAMIGEMERIDTGSGWFNYYVETVNQEIALKDSEEPFGAAGPAGPLDGFTGYVSNFRGSDTGSQAFDVYVDSVQRSLRAREGTDEWS